MCGSRSVTAARRLQRQAPTNKEFIEHATRSHPHPSPSQTGSRAATLPPKGGRTHLASQTSCRIGMTWSAAQCHSRTTGARDPLALKAAADHSIQKMVPMTPQPIKNTPTDATARNSYELKMRAMGNPLFKSAAMSIIAAGLFQGCFVSTMNSFRRAIVIMSRGGSCVSGALNGFAIDEPYQFQRRR
jgi:hypothetical protein